MPTYKIDLEDGRSFRVDADDQQAALSGLQAHITRPQQPASRFDVAGARSAGYSDDEIVNHLSANGHVAFDFNGARSAGYTPAEILHAIQTRNGEDVGTLTPDGRGIVGVGPFAEPQQPRPQTPAPTRQPDTNILTAPQHGLASAVKGVGKTLRHYTPLSGAADAVERAGADITPANYQPAGVWTDDTRISLADAPRAVAEAAPAMAAGILAARLLARRFAPMTAAIAGAGGMMAATQLGQRAEDRAAVRTGDADAAPSTSDKAVAAGAMVPQVLLQGLAGARYLPGANRMTSVGRTGATQAVGNLAKTAAVEGITEGAQNAIEQTGRTIGTDGGVTINPAEVRNAATVGAATGAAFGTGRAARDVGHAARFRDIDPTVARTVADDIDAAAGGKLASPKQGYAAVRRVGDDYRADYRAAERAFRAEANIGMGDANGILIRARKGDLTAHDIDTLESAAAGTQHGPDVVALAKKLTTLTRLKNTAEFNTADKTFVGGVGRKLEKSVRALSNPVAAGSLGLASASLGALPHTPAALGTLGATWGAARVLDRVMGTRSPAKTFVDKFGSR